MARKILRRGRRRPPWWFMPAVMAGVAVATLALAAMMMTAVE